MFRTNVDPFRSVVAYDSDEKLRQALANVPDSGMEDSGRSDDFSINDDWILPSFDPETTEAQSMEEEMKRLQVLNSYLILDSDREVEFERITRITARTFDVPICLVTLIDIGRVWFVSCRGFPSDSRESSRKLSFCTHAIQSKFSPAEQEKRQLDALHREQLLHPMLIVPDATKDPRFCKNPFVTGPPNLRFYAGAPLITPEGYRIGTLCINDLRARPEGLSDDEREILQDLAAMVVNVMVNRKIKLEAEKSRQTPEQIIACTAHDLMTPLTGIQLSLSLLCADDELKQIIGTNRSELIFTAASCSELLRRICQQAIDGLRDKSSGKIDCSNNGLTSDKIKPFRHTIMKDLVRSLHLIMNPIQKAVPIIITLDKEVPATIEADDLKLFRSALNLLDNAASRCSTGSIHLRIYVKHNEQPSLVFECEDTGTDIDVSEYPYLFQVQENPTDHSLDDIDSQKLALTSIATLISSMKGDYGFRARHVDCNGKPAFNSKGRRQHGSIFWFSVPLVSSSEVRVHQVVKTGQSNTPAIDSLDRVKSANVVDRNGDVNTDDGRSDKELNANLVLPHSKEIIPGSIENVKEVEVLEKPMKRNLSFGNSRQRILLRVDSLDQAESISSSCLGAIYVPEVRPTSSTPESNDVDMVPSTSCYSDGLYPTSAIMPPNKDNKMSLETSDAISALECFHMHTIGHVFSNQSTTNSCIGIQSLQTNLQNAEHQRMLNGISSASQGSDVNDTTGRTLQKQNSSNANVGNTHSISETNGPAVCTSISETYPSRTERAQRMRRALVIDDSVVIRKVVSRALNKIGFADLTLAEDGLEGLHELKKKIYDLVFCDFLMPKMDGMDCVRQYREWERENRPWFRQLIVGMSAHANINDGGQGIQVGMDDFKPKPITIQTLTEIQSWDLCKAKSEQIDEIEMKNMDNPVFVDHDDGLGSYSAIPANVQTGDINGDSRRQNQEHACLIATDMCCADLNVLKSSLEDKGWSAVVVQEGVDALHMLQQRNWDAVLIDNDLSETKDGQSCILCFREWEGKNRVNSQQNIFLLCENYILSPMEGSSILVQPPSGYNGLLPKPVRWDDLEYVLQKNSIEKNMNIICR